MTIPTLMFEGRWYAGHARSPIKRKCVARESRLCSRKDSRHTAAVHLLEAGVDVNVIRGWLRHVSLNTTNRYAEITMRMKTEAMKLCAPNGVDQGASRQAVRQTDASLLHWLGSL
ncbi:MAG: tyrosine-based site-specific recombinase [Gammaproteobacteria bacterium]|nr:tyrosine-based site-specific recombinase [Gammaproteobacteria bacterium]